MILMVNRNTLILTKEKKIKSIELNKTKFKLKLKIINEDNSYDTNEDFNDSYSYLNEINFNNNYKKNKNRYLNEYNQYSLTLIFIDFLKNLNDKIKDNYNLLMTNLHKI